MESHKGSFNNNTFEILMDQLQASCPPGFLTTKEEKIDANNTLGAPILEKNRSRLPEPHHEALRISPPTQKHATERIPSSPRLYRPPSSPRAYQTPSSPRIYFPPTSPRAYRPPISPRAPSFERNRSFNKPRKNSRRLYVFNVPNDTTEQKFREYFGEYGTVTSCGFDTEDSFNKDSKSGFIAFEKSSETEYVLENQHLKLGGQPIRVKRATSQKTQLFVGGYDLYATKTELIAFFSKFGEVCDFVMKFNSEGVNRCFGFVTFRDSEDAVNKLVEERFLECMGKTVEIKRATQTKRSYTPYGGTPMAKRVPSSPRFNRDSLEFRNTPSMSPRSSERIRLPSSSNSHDLDVPIDGTRMYSRKFFAPTRRGMTASKGQNN